MDFAEMIQNYVIEEALILIPVLLILGYMLKRTPNVVDWIIPWVLLILGIALALMIMGFTANALIQGILVVGAAVLLHQLYKQTKGENK